ncbi:MAG: hypothetical protein GXO09_03550 [Crenarchaeota archaeon]|nr:hypothetical protein [Thermoproteota archaeon]
MKLLDIVRRGVIGLDDVASADNEAGMEEFRELVLEPALPQLTLLLTGKNTLLLDGEASRLRLNSPHNTYHVDVEPKRALGNRVLEALLPLRPAPPNWVMDLKVLVERHERLLDSIGASAPPYDYHGLVCEGRECRRLDYTGGVRLVVRDAGSVEPLRTVELGIYRPVVVGYRAYALSVYRVRRRTTISFNFIAVKGGLRPWILTCLEGKCTCTIDEYGRVECIEGGIVARRVKGIRFWHSIIAALYSRLLNRLENESSTWLHMPPCMLILDHRFDGKVLELLVWNACPFEASGCMRLRGYKVTRVLLNGVEHPRPGESYEDVCLSLEAFTFTCLTLRVKRAPRVLFERRRGTRLC